MKIMSANVNGFMFRASQIQNFILEQNLDLMAFQELHFWRMILFIILNKKLRAHSV